MKKVISAFLTLFVAVGFGFNGQAQSIKTPSLSPFSTVKQNFGLTELTVEYSRPSARGRAVFGDVVPFDAIWRTGANACTKITFGEDVKIEGKVVPAGTYSLFTIPSKTEWTIILNKNTKLSGAFGYSEAEDLMRFKAAVKTKAEKTETFTIDFANLKPLQATLEMSWENTVIAFDITTEVDERVMKNIETTMAKDARPFYTAASYYYDNKKDMKQALDWATKAFELNPDAYWVANLKAKIQLELKDYKNAMATAEIVKKLATADGDNAYVKMADEIIATAKKGGK